MHSSHFNVVLPVHENEELIPCPSVDTNSSASWLIFNTANGNFQTLTQSELSLLRSFETHVQNAPLASASAISDSPETSSAYNACKSDSPNSQSPCKQTIVNSLLKQGFLTTLSTEEEIALLKEKFLQNSQDTDTFDIAFAPTYDCNCRCPYCYEEGRKQDTSIMDNKVIEATLELVKTRFQQAPFKTLAVQWYGGDPQLALDAVQSLSSKLIAFCKQQNIQYRALMLSNATRIGEQQAELIKSCQIDTLLITIEGPEEIHNLRRPTREGYNSYKRTLAAIHALLAQGINIECTCNIDKVTLPLFSEFRRTFYAETGLFIKPTKLNDYASTYGCGAFCSPHFELMNHKEFAQAAFNFFMETQPQETDFQAMLAPIPNFCTGQKASYLVIDSHGDVYGCDGFMGDTNYKLFSVFDSPTTWNFTSITNNPFKEEKCRMCKVLPQCLGNCNWERALCGDPCHPLKTMLPAYLRAWNKSLQI